MGFTNSWSEIMLDSLGKIWLSIAMYLPQVLGALFILIIGLVASGVLGRLASKLFTYTRIDSLNEKLGLRQELASLGLKHTFADVIGAAVRWFFIVITLITIVDILHIPQLTNFLQDLALYMPNVIIAVVILAIGLAAGSFIHDMSERALKASGMPDTSIRIMTNLTKWAIFIFALMAGLVQLGVASSMIQILFAGVVIMVALAGGIAFGLGGRDKAQKIIDKLEEEILRKK